MARLKKVLIVLVVVVAVGAVGVFAYVTSKNDNGLKKADIDLSQVVIEQPTEETDTDSGEETNSTVAEPTVVEEGAVVDFVYDMNESEEDYIKSGSKVVIEGSGSVVDLQANRVQNEVTEDGVQVAKGSEEETLRFYMKQAKDRDNYMYAVTDFDFSDGFGIYFSPKYDIDPTMIGGSSACMSGPNHTNIRISELNYEEGDASYWRKKKITENNFGYYASIVPEDSIPYGTEYVLGTGLRDHMKLENLIVFNEDPTLQGSNVQLLCDDYIKINFGEGHYFETYNTDSGMFHGVMIIQHGTRVFILEGDTDTIDTLKDIMSATADRCIYVY